MMSGADPGSSPPGPRETVARSGDKRSFSRRTVGLAVPAALLCGLFLGGFALFLLSLDRSERDPDGAADAIVALTGGAGRIEDALDLLGRGFGRRLLITGVNERTSRERIAQLSPRLRELVECCVDLDYRARNTVGNATEIGRWVREKGFRSLVIVTSYYHLPRTLAELDEALPDIRKVPYGVVAARADAEWSAAFVRGRILLSEYVKFVAVAVRTRVAGWFAPARSVATGRGSVAAVPGAG